ncbi:MAG: methyltransferase domain-containing protein [Terracidiphilus sp.]
MRCTDCGFSFYNPRLENDELQRLYESYRLPEYLEMRNSFEPWYTPKMNAELASSSFYKKRRERLSKTLAPHLEGRQIRRVLDHGGDRGDLVAGLFPEAEAFVFDISGVAPADGVKAVSDPTECAADLIINSNVLEHVGFPLALAKQILDSAQADSLVFLEVPCEIPTGAYRVARRVAQIAVTTAMRPAKSSALMTPKALYLMHEHINYFTVRSLETLMKCAGGTIIAAGSYESSSVAGMAQFAWCLGTPEKRK